MKRSIGFLAAVTVAVLLAILPPVAGAPESQADRATAGQVVPLTKEQLVSVVPHFYIFDYEGEPQPGKRYWLRVNDSTWVERYPDGLQSTFKVLGHAKINDTEGTVVVKVSGSPRKTGTVNGGGLQAFIPDKGSTVMHHWYRNIDRGDTEWNDLGPMYNIE